MESFVAIDVETANKVLSSICSIGAVKVIDGVITESFYQLVKPEPEYFNYYFSTQIHGITPEMTENAPTFDCVWQRVHQFADGLPFVAHNKAFDEKCIREAHKVYGMIYPDYDFHCSLMLARRTIPRALCQSFSLPSLCNFLGIPFENHHNALADALGCAKAFLALQPQK